MTYSTTPYLRHYGIKGMKWKHHKYVVDTNKKIAKSFNDNKRQQFVDKQRQVMNYRTNNQQKNLAATRQIVKTTNSVGTKLGNKARKVVSALKAFGKTLASIPSKVVNAGKNFLKAFKNPIQDKYVKTTYTTVGMSNAKGEDRTAHITTTETGTIKNGKKTVTSRTTKTERK